MPKQQNPKATRFMPLLVVGMMLNTLGIVFTSLGNVRFLFMAVGIAMIFAFLIVALSGARGRDESDG